jgi:hypothetical protein
MMSKLFACLQGDLIPAVLDHCNVLINVFYLMLLLERLHCPELSKIKDIQVGGVRGLEAQLKLPATVLWQSVECLHQQPVRVIDGNVWFCIILLEPDVPWSPVGPLGNGSVTQSLSQPVAVNISVYINTFCDYGTRTASHWMKGEMCTFLCHHSPVSGF